MNFTEFNNLSEKYGYKFSRMDWLEISQPYLKKEVWLDNVGDCLLLAKFIKFLRSCGDNEFKISSTIKEPQKGEVKGSNIVFCFKNHKVTSELQETINNLLVKVADIESERMKYKANVPMEIRELYAKGSHYTNEEIEQIIKYEEKHRPKKKMTKNVEIGLSLYDIYMYNKNKGYFGHSKIKEYSYLYDWCVLNNLANDIGEGYSGVIGKEKYQQVKNWITAYEKYKNNLTD